MVAVIACLRAGASVKSEPPCAGHSLLALARKEMQANSKPAAAPPALQTGPGSHCGQLSTCRRAHVSDKLERSAELLRSGSIAAGKTGIICQVDNCHLSKRGGPRARATGRAVGKPTGLL